MFKKRSDPGLQDIVAALSEFRSGRLGSRVPLREGASDELKQVRDSINDTLGRAEELVESLRDGTLILMHEMKYPFIAARSWMLRARKDLPASALRDELDLLIVQIDEARAATAIMADISLQIASRDDRTNFAATGLSQVCEDVAIELGAFAQQRSQFVRVMGEEVAVFGRHQLLVIAVRNLVHNACRHSPANSVVDLLFGRAGANAWIEVRDRGSGIPEKISQEIIAGHSTNISPLGSRTTEGGGMGLGLRLSKAIFRRHRATIDIAQRDDGPGTRFRVEMPLS